jgi:hypothetical protein
MHMDVLIACEKLRNEVVFERPFGPFGGVASIVVRRHLLKVGGLVVHEGITFFRTPTVDALQSWAETYSIGLVVDSFACCKSSRASL